VRIFLGEISQKQNRKLRKSISKEKEEKNKEKERREKRSEITKHLITPSIVQ